MNPRCYFDAIRTTRFRTATRLTQRIFCLLAGIFCVDVEGGVAFLSADQITAKKHNTGGQFVVSGDPSAPQGYLQVYIAAYQNMNLGTQNISTFYPRLGVKISSNAFSGDDKTYNSLVGVKQGDMLVIELPGRKFTAGLSQISGRAAIRTPLPITRRDDFSFEGVVSSVPSSEKTLADQGPNIATDIGNLFGAQGTATAKTAIGFFDVASSSVKTVLHLKENHNYVDSEKTLRIAGSAEEASDDDVLQPGALLFYSNEMNKWIRRVSQDLEAKDSKWAWTGKKLRYRENDVPSAGNFRTECTYVLLVFSCMDTVVLRDDWMASRNPDAYGDGGDPNRFGSCKHLNTLNKTLSGSFSSITDLFSKLSDSEKEITAIKDEIDKSTALTQRDKDKLKNYYNRETDNLYDHCLLPQDVKALLKQVGNNTGDATSIIHLQRVRERIEKKPDGLWAQFANGVNSP
jgi:hypothetical protein